MISWALGIITIIGTIWILLRVTRYGRIATKLANGEPLTKREQKLYDGMRRNAR